MKYLLFVVVMVFLSTISFAEPVSVSPYRIIRVLDGDTVEIQASWLPPELKQSLLLRIIGIDTPEKGHKAKCAQEAVDSLKAKFFLEKELQKSKTTTVVIKKWDKYGGRVLGDVILDGVPLSKKMIDSGLAKPYNGGKKEGWC